MNDLEKARTVPCPGCKRPADSACVDLETNREVAGVHQVRIYRAYVVAEADAHNRACALAAEVEQLRAALAVIHDLHTDSPAGVCPSCYRLADASDADDGLVAWPCPTIRAIPKETR